MPSTQKRHFLRPIPPPTKPFQTIGIDHIGLFKRTADKNTYAVVATDYISKWVEAEAVPGTSTELVLTFLRKKHRLLVRRPKEAYSLRFTSDGRIPVRVQHSARLGDFEQPEKADGCGVCSQYGPQERVPRISISTSLRS